MQVAGFERVFAIADEDMERENEVKTSAVHFLRFELSDAMAAKLKGGAALSIGIDHPNYQHQISPAPENVRAALAADLAEVAFRRRPACPVFPFPLDRGVHQVGDADGGRDQAEQRTLLPRQPCRWRRRAGCR